MPDKVEMVVEWIEMVSLDQVVLVQRDYHQMTMDCYHYLPQEENSDHLFELFSTLFLLVWKTGGHLVPLLMEVLGLVMDWVMEVLL